MARTSHDFLLPLAPEGELRLLGGLLVEDTEDELVCALGFRWGDASEGERGIALLAYVDFSLECIYID